MDLAERLYADLQARGVRCWYALEDLKIGESILGGIDQGIRLHDKLLLLLSESSVNSAWVDAEVQMALVRERSERRRVLFPIRIDDAVLTSEAAWAALIRGDYHIGDFRQWKAHDSCQQGFQRLLRDLKAEQR
ncbi:MAG TPA: toll/interleukin-1 receptor domain-containing protein [Herpetosiphonaceae bacterium]